MKGIIQKNHLMIPLYHGTFTLFLDSIVKHGLGGANPMKDWNVLELAREILVLSEKHLIKSNIYINLHGSFRRMIRQQPGKMNWQHGDTYLSPVKQTAIRYAANMRFGSELLTYTLDFLEELVRHEVPGVKDDIYQRFPQAFRVLDLSCAPILIEANGVPDSALAGEDGGHASVNLRVIDDVLRNHPGYADALIGQNNFRLRQPIPVEALRFWLMNVSRWDRYSPEIALYEINISPGD